jgi:hypothetical protein
MSLQYIMTTNTSSRNSMPVWSPRRPAPEVLVGAAPAAAAAPRDGVVEAQAIKIEADAIASRTFAATCRDGIKNIEWVIGDGGFWDIGFKYHL